MYYSDFGSFPENKEKLRMTLGPFKNEGNEMSQSIVASSDHVITRQIVRLLHTSDIHSDTEKRKRIIFDEFIQKNLGDSVTIQTSLKA